MRFTLSLFAASLVALLAAPALADTGAAMKGGMSMTHACAAGQKWVNGYKKKSGAQVKGYCRGAKAASAKTAGSASK